jgi:hypothetical protein
MSGNSKVNKCTVALFLSRKSIPQLIQDAKSYVDQMTGNANFPNPVPSLASVTTLINNLEAAYTLNQTRAMGANANMRYEAGVLKLSLKALGIYVEFTGNQSPDHAQDIIQSSGMRLKKVSIKPPRVFSVKPGPVPGSVKLDTKAVKRGSYNYQATTTPNDPNSWKELYQGTRVKFQATGLKSGNTYSFRTCTVDKNGKGAWSVTITTIIL